MKKDDLDIISNVANTLALLEQSSEHQAHREILASCWVALRNILLKNGRQQVRTQTVRDGIEHEWPENKADCWEALK